MYCEEVVEGMRHCYVTAVQLFRLNPGVVWCDVVISSEYVRKISFPNLRYFSSTWLK